MSDLFNNKDNSPIDGKAALEQLVGDNAKYKTVEDLAKAALHGQAHITKIEEENAQLRDQVAKAATVDELLAQIRNGNLSEHDQPPQGNSAENDQSRQSQGQDTVDIEALLEKKLADRDAISRAQANREYVTKVLTDKYGDAAAELYNAAKASVDIDLTQLAETSPKAVLKLVTAHQTESKSASGLSGGHNRDQGSMNSGQHALSKKAIQARYAKGEISLDQKHRLENDGFTQLGEDFWK
jgi:hypothetical protein